MGWTPGVVGWVVPEPRGRLLSPIAEALVVRILLELEEASESRGLRQQRWVE